jgi:hypothetical protein
MTVRCKFKCTERTERPKNWNGGPDGEKVYDFKFSAVSEGSEENKKFWQYTPGGQISVTTVLLDAFKVGEEYYVDFSLPVATDA